MTGALLAERARLIQEGSRLADAGRRSWSFAVQAVGALVLFALAPLLPRAQHVFGALSVREMFCFITPGSLGTFASMLFYGSPRFGPDSRAYRVSEAVESFFLYSINVATVFGTKMTWPVPWVLCPFTAVFWAVSKPFESRLHVAIMGSTHAALAVAYVVRGDTQRVAVDLAVGIACLLTYAAVAREGRKNLEVEAERNVARARLNEQLLDEARRRIATALHARIGGEIRALAAALEELRDGDGHATKAEEDAPSTPNHDPLTEQARAALAELGDVTTGKRAPAVRSLSELRDRVDRKCRPLCADRAYETVLGPAASGEPGGGRLGVSDDDVLVLVHVAQELVRNAVIHGGARTVRVALDGHDERDAKTVLRVEDDGSGLSRERFAAATGGLDNAKQRVRERGGVVELLEAAQGTTLRVTLPCSRGDVRFDAGRSESAPATNASP